MAETFEIGWAAPPLAEQAACEGVPPNALEHLQKDADAISRLSLRGLLTDGERDKAVRRLGKQIGIWRMNEHNEKGPAE